MGRPPHDGVTVRASTSKPVLYRRWPTRAEMVMATVIASTTEAIAEPDTGDLAQDLATLPHSMRERRDDRPLTMLGLLAELGQTAAESLRGLIFWWGADPVDPLAAPAEARGELGAAEIRTTVLALPLDLARHELAIRAAMPSERFETIVRTIVLPS